MFIKKDLRKIQEILTDETDERLALRLSKRSAEFLGSTATLFNGPIAAPALRNLRSLNLYDNELTSIVGIGVLANSPLEDLNLGMNKLTSLPLELGLLTSLRSLWLDDNLFESLPLSVCELSGLVALRLSGNALRALSPSLAQLQSIEVLALDNNEFSSVPPCLWELTRLRELYIRQNTISELPEDVERLLRLEVLSCSSNRLAALPRALAKIDTLRRIYANGNVIKAVPEELCRLERLEVLNLANNALASVPASWQVRWGPLLPPPLSCMGGERGTTVLLTGNPLCVAARSEGGRAEGGGGTGAMDLAVEAS